MKKTVSDNIPGVHHWRRCFNMLAAMLALALQITVPSLASAASFSADPSDAEITYCHIFREPLVPVGGKTTARENATLAAAITAFEARQKPEDYSALTSFLRSHPHSVWRASLQLNLGIWYARDCFYNRALTALIEAWDLSKSENAMPGKGIADSAVGELAHLYGTFGCTEALVPVLNEIKDREILGSARQKVVSARSMLTYIYKHPDHAYNCGPLVLDILQQQAHPGAKHLLELYDPEEDIVGRNIDDLAKLATKSGLPMVAVKHPAGSAFPVPSVVHWKMRHFDVLLQKDGDRYLIRNPYSHHEQWVTQAALDEETTGNVLVPTDKIPSEWKRLSTAEGKKVWGGCHTGDCNPNNTDPCQTSSGGCCPTPMASYSIQMALVNLHISDTPISYQPPRGKAVTCQINYNHREANQPETFDFPNLGRLWTFTWVSYVNDTNSASNDAMVSIYELGGGTKLFYFANAATTTSDRNYEDNSVLERTLNGNAVTQYVRKFRDGSKYVYTKRTSTGVGDRRVFLEKMYDPQGNFLAINYDANLRISGLTDAVGQTSTITYGSNTVGNAQFYKITQITDPFNRSASFTYTATGKLASITDPVGIVSQFTYDGDFIRKLTTPYGETSFFGGEDQWGFEGVNDHRWLEVTDPEGGKERVEYYQDTPPGGVNPVDPAIPPGLNTYPNGRVIENQLLDTRSTYYWDKKAMMIAPRDFTQAHVYHWLHDRLQNQITDVLECEKLPLESWKWYNYPGQTEPYYMGGTSSYPIGVGRAIDDQGTVQWFQREYNVQGNRTKEIDPIGRVTTYVYDSSGNPDTTGIDLLEVRNTTGGLDELLKSYTYTDATHPTSIHKPLTMKDAAGQVTGMTYNSQGQMLTRTVTRNGQNETTNWIYDGNGYLQSVTMPFTGATTSYTYDAAGRVRTKTDSEQHTLTYDYDDIDRPTKVTYPDADLTYAQIIYNRLDPEWKRDRLGRWTHLVHDGLRRVVRVDDPAGHSVKYTWCVCGALEAWADGEGRETRFAYDLERRLIQRTYSDSSAVQYTYDPYRDLRTKQVDAVGNSKNVVYNLDDTIQQISYSGGAIATSGVNYYYDQQRLRVIQMVDGTGTTNCSYYPIAAGTLGSGQLSSIDGPLDDDSHRYAISYTYDELGRRLSSAIDGISWSQAFDALGRVTQEANPLGQFDNFYLNATNRLSGVNYPNGQTVGFSYWPISAVSGTGNGDERLQTIWNKLADGTTLSKHDYTYDAAGQIASWQQQSDSNAPVQYGLVYDGAGELLDVTKQDPTNGTTQYYYAYDNAGNRSVEQVNSVLAVSNYNDLNQLTSRSGSGAMIFEGTVNKPSTVTVGGQPAEVRPVGNPPTVFRFRGKANVSPGARSVEIKAVDANSNVTVNHAQVTVTAGVAEQNYSYDSNGNLLTDGTRIFAWDAENRLVKVTKGSDVQEFIYNGASQRVAEKFNGSIIRRWVWDGFDLREERDPSGAVTKRYYSQGAILSPTIPAPNASKFFYTRDHLDSVRELTDNTGAIEARYDYDVWGRRTKLSAVLDADFSYTGHYWDDFAGVNLTYYRPYDPDFGRWLSRDPIAELGGPNLYAYVTENPVNLSDRLGLCDCLDKGKEMTLRDMWKDPDENLKKAGLDKWQFGCYLAETSCQVGCVTCFPKDIGGRCPNFCKRQFDICMRGGTSPNPPVPFPNSPNPPRPPAIPPATF